MWIAKLFIASGPALVIFVVLFVLLGGDAKAVLVILLVFFGTVADELKEDRRVCAATERMRGTTADGVAVHERVQKRVREKPAEVLLSAALLGSPRARGLHAGQDIGLLREQHRPSGRRRSPWLAGSSGRLFGF